MKKLNELKLEKIEGGFKFFCSYITRAKDDRPLAEDTSATIWEDEAYFSEDPESSFVKYSHKGTTKGCFWVEETRELATLEDFCAVIKNALNALAAD